MNESLVNLTRFIEGFNLRRSNGAVYFNAIVILAINGIEKKEHTEVHIITSDQLGTIYFLNPAIKLYEFPDFFDAKKYLFSYVSGQCLKFEIGKYIISIYPQVK